MIKILAYPIGLVATIVEEGQPLLVLKVAELLEDWGSSVKDEKGYSTHFLIDNSDNEWKVLNADHGLNLMELKSLTEFLKTNIPPEILTFCKRLE